MKRISSKSTFFSKRIFPIIWFGLLVVFAAGSAMDGTIEQDPMALLVPVFMGVAGFFLMRFFVWDLADEVLDNGDHLLVRRGSEEERIALSNIMNVSASLNMNPQRVTLRLVTPGKFGQNVSFSPVASFALNPFAKSPVVEELIVRAHQARSRRAA
jgi:hypothetical protein